MARRCTRVPASAISVAVSGNGQYRGRRGGLAGHLERLGRSRPPAEASAYTTRRHLDGACSEDGDLQEHVVPTGEWPAEAEPRAALTAGRSPSRAARRTRWRT